MATRSARDNKALNAKHAEILRALLKQPENKLCVDCKQKDARWASTNIGCFMCIQCSGIHRGMGVHISRVKSIDLDTWTPDQVSLVQRWGNVRVNQYWEAHLHPGHIPRSSQIENFIRSKYESKRWAMEGPVPEPESLGPPVANDTRADADAKDNQPLSTQITDTQQPATLSPPKSIPATSTLSKRNVLAPTPSDPPSNSASQSAPVAAAANNKGLFDIDFSSEATSKASSATQPAARQDVKNDILSLFGSASSGSIAPPIQSPAKSGLWGAGATFQGNDNLSATFGGLQLDAASATAPSDPWTSFSTVPTSQQLKPASLIGGAVTQAAPSSIDDDVFGGFASAATTTTMTGGAPGQKDVFADIWK